MRRIVLVGSASNFEGHKKTVYGLTDAFREIGGYAIDIITNYGRFALEDDEIGEAEKSIYELLENADYDGAVIDNNIGRDSLMSDIAGIFRRKNIPYVALDNGLLSCPYFGQNSYNTTKLLIEHMLREHNARKINLVVRNKEDYVGRMACKAYKSVLDSNGMAFEEDRIFEQVVSIENGEALYGMFKERNKDDADAVILYHDINAIGLINSYEREGIRVPEDVRIASLHYSANSMVYRPDITGIVVEDYENARSAAYALHKIISGEEVSDENYLEGRIKYGRSCGCERLRDEDFDKKSYQNIVLAKVGNAGQIKAMMTYNNSLSNICTLEMLDANINDMMTKIGCDEYCVCINKRDIDYLTDVGAVHHTVLGESFDSQMYVISCGSKNEIYNKAFNTSDLLPYKPNEGDLHIFMPLHNGPEVFGYIAIRNNAFPVEVYNYRICHESISYSIERLHQELILRATINELDRLRMIDSMTGTYNKQGLEFFKPQFFGTNRAIIAIADIDGLKKINDVYGHVQGDLAIRISANALLESINPGDVVIRYGGDEFAIMSRNLDEEFWDNFSAKANGIINNNIVNRGLGYKFRLSFGYSEYNPSNGNFDSAMESADLKMYNDKLLHKGVRTN